MASGGDTSDSSRVSDASFFLGVIEAFRGRGKVVIVAVGVGACGVHLFMFLVSRPASLSYFSYYFDSLVMSVGCFVPPLSNRPLFLPRISIVHSPALQTVFPSSIS